MLASLTQDTAPDKPEKAVEMVVDRIIRRSKAGCPEKAIRQEILQLVATWDPSLHPGLDTIDGAIIHYSGLSQTLATPLNAEDQAEVVLGMPASDCDKGHARVVIGVLDGMKSKGVAVDANGGLRQQSTWTLAAVKPESLARQVWFDLKRKGPVGYDEVSRVLQVVIDRDAEQRRRDLTGRMTGTSAQPEGLVELERYLKAITGVVKPADVVAVRQWLWQVKTKQVGGHGERHLMLVFLGAQGAGKSQAVLRLVAPWAELADPGMTAEALTDERAKPGLASKAIGILDELAGLGRSDAAAIKHTITLSEISYRPMGTNERRVLPMRTSFIGTSNKSVAELVKDPTGARRFYEIQTLDRMDWGTINAIDYQVLWTAVSEFDPAPAIAGAALIAAEQQRLVWRDTVELWLTGEDEALWPQVPLEGGAFLPSVRGDAWTSTAVLYQRYVTWCHDAGEKPITRELVGRRLGELGWIKVRGSRADGQVPGYRRPPLPDATPHTLHTPAQASSPAPVVQGVHGVQTGPRAPVGRSGVL